MKQIIFLIAIIIIAVSGFFIGMKSIKVDKPITITDTTIIIDTIIPNPAIIKKWITRIDTDTVYSVDSVPVIVRIPIEATIYSDSNYYAKISGYKANLDSIAIYRNTTIINNTKFVKTKPKWSIGISGGYGVTSKNISPFVGVGITYNLFYW